jgi:hypothetical protein
MAYDPSRPMRPCLGCGGEDQGPRDQVGLSDGSTAYWHLDCHVMLRNCPVCEAILDTTPGGFGDHLKNEDLVDHINHPDTSANHEIFTTANAAEYAASHQASKRFSKDGA